MKKQLELTDFSGLNKRMILASRKQLHSLVWNRYQEWLLEHPDYCNDPTFKYREEYALKSLRALRLIKKIYARS